MISVEILNVPVKLQILNMKLQGLFVEKTYRFPKLSID